MPVITITGAIVFKHLRDTSLIPGKLLSAENVTKALLFIQDGFEKAKVDLITKISVFISNGTDNNIYLKKLRWNNEYKNYVCE